MATIETRKRSKKTVYRAKIRLLGFSPVEATFDRKSDATAWVRKTEADMRAGRFMPEWHNSKRTLAEALDVYESGILPSLRPNTQKAYRSRLSFWRTRLGSVRIAHIRPEVIQAGMSAVMAMPGRSGGKNGPASTRSYLAALSAVLTHAVHIGWLQANPCSLVQKPRLPRQRVRFLESVEVDRLLQACRESESEGLADFVIMLLCTGCRKGELLTLRWRDIDWKGSCMRLIETKNGQPRNVPLVPPAMVVLEERSRLRRLDDDRVFPPAPGAKMRNPSLAFRAACDKAGLGDFRIHDCRHHAASVLAMAGISLQVIGNLLGHSSTAMSERYAHLSPSSVASAVGPVLGGITGQ